MQGNVRPEAMERITTAELAEAFIDEQWKREFMTKKRVFTTNCKVIIICRVWNCPNSQRLKSAFGASGIYATSSNITKSAIPIC